MVSSHPERAIGFVQFISKLNFSGQLISINGGTV
jgi:hypothetical protein